MKTKLYFLFLMLSLSGLMGTSCTKDAEKGDPVFALPPETQTGANTFGVTINGKVYVPRDPNGGGINPSSKGMTLFGATNFSWYDLAIKDGKSSVGFNILIHMPQITTVGKVILSQSDFKEQYDSGTFTHIHFKIWDANIRNYAYYGSIADQGELNITRLSNGIRSGNFMGKFVRYDNPNEFITITDGRFDINGFTLPNHPFP